MKNTILKINIFFLLILLWSIPKSNLLAQEGWTLAADQSTIRIEGTSNIHDWVSEVTKMTSQADISFGEDGSINVKALEVNIPVTGVKSSKGAIMNKKTYKALKSDKFPNIKYSLNSVTNLSEITNKFRIKANGNLSISGTTKNIAMEVVATQVSSTKMVFEGTKKLKMTTFNVEPPTALMGALTTGDDITIAFKVVFQKD